MTKIRNLMDRLKVLKYQTEVLELEKTMNEMKNEILSTADLINKKKNL